LARGVKIALLLRPKAPSSPAASAAVQSPDGNRMPRVITV
jgi:hypothetical protein